MDIAGCGSDGIKLYNSSDNTIRDNTLDSTGGILLWALPGETWFSQNNDILNNTISHCRGAGIALLAEANGDQLEPRNSITAFLDVSPFSCFGGIV